MKRRTDDFSDFTVRVLPSWMDRRGTECKRAVTKERKKKKVGQRAKIIKSNNCFLAAVVGC
jgi:hypothetical protein